MKTTQEKLALGAGRRKERDDQDKTVAQSVYLLQSFLNQVVG